MMQKPIIYYDNMIPPTYIRLVSERLNLDHIVHTEATEQPMRYSDIRRLAETGLFNISFKYNRQTRNGEYDEDFHAEFKLSQLIDLEIGEWKV